MTNVRLSGRFDRTEPFAPRFSWPGTAVVSRFKGTKLGVRLKDDGKNWFQVILDGEPSAVFKVESGRELYLVAEGVADGVHDVQLYKRTEAEMGETTFLGFDAPTQLLPPTTMPDRRIEFIGDSITAGYGNEGPGALCPYKAEQENEYVTYGAIAARTLGAEHTNLSWSGKTVGEMTNFYERTLPSRADLRWDFASWTPQLVVVNVGTNNFAVADPGEARFVQQYTVLIHRIRQVYPAALVVCALGPMLSDGYPVGRHNLTLARRYLSVAVKLLRTTDARVELLEFPEQKHVNGLGCGFHPSLKTHKLMADQLTSFAREKLAW